MIKAPLPMDIPPPDPTVQRQIKKRVVHSRTGVRKRSIEVVSGNACIRSKNVRSKIKLEDKMPKKATKAEVKKERAPQKVKAVIEAKGYPNGTLPKGKELHHVKPVAEGGKTTKENTRVVTKAKHKQIHQNRAKKGKI